MLLGASHYTAASNQTLPKAKTVQLTDLEGILAGCATSEWGKRWVAAQRTA